MPVQANKDLVRAMIDQVWNAGRLDKLPEFWAAETRGEAEELHQVLTGAFPDLQVQIEDMVAEADRVVTRLTFEGTHRGPFRGIEPTGRRVRFGAIRIYRLTDGKVIETWAHQDALGLLQQIRG
jgi:predicted ester cyclase